MEEDEIALLNNNLDNSDSSGENEVSMFIIFLYILVNYEQCLFQTEIWIISNTRFTATSMEEEEKFTRKNR